MVLHTIIGEYDVLYAQQRELAFVKNSKQEIMSTNPADFLKSTCVDNKNLRCKRKIL